MRAIIGMAAIMIGATTLPSVPAAAAPPGSYQQSCNAIRDDGRGQLSAQCRDTRGRYRFSSIDYRSCQSEIGNDNGQLFCNGGRPGAQRPDADRPGDGRPGGGYQGGGYQGGGWSGALPGGSWQRSCRNSAARGARVTAQCRSDHDRWFDTSIDTRACRSGRLANQNGQLVCE